MTEQITILNQYMSITISAMGAQMKSIKKDGKELLWQGDPSVWSGQAPVLFPVCGGLKDNKFIFEGMEYTLPRHGFARTSLFEIENCSKTEATFLLRSNAKTLNCYPFGFEFRITYKIEETTLSIDYSVKNTCDKDMYFSMGSHEAYNCPEGIEAYSVIFEKAEDLQYNSLTADGLVKYETTSLGENITELPLKYKYFENDALVFTGLKSRKAILKNNLTGYTMELSFPGKDYFLLWTKPEGKYICLEPWCGVADFVDSDYNIKNKKGIITLPPHEQFNRVHTINF